MSEDLSKLTGIKHQREYVKETLMDKFKARWYLEKPIEKIIFLWGLISSILAMGYLIKFIGGLF